MPSYAKQAIEKSFLKILNEKPFSSITVKMIVDDCHVNRNSFYYHFQDIPDLLEELLVHSIDKIIENIPVGRPIGEGIESILQNVVKNKRAILHIWNSASRESFEKQLMRACDYVVCSYMKHFSERVVAQEKDIALISNFLKCELFGQLMDWLNQDMSYDIVEHARVLVQFFDGTFQAAVNRSKN